MRECRAYATERIEAIKTNGVASKFIRSIEEIEPGPVVLYVRVSRSQQKKRGTLARQRDDLEWESERRGFHVLAVFEETASGWADDRVRFECAAVAAEEAGAVLVADSTDRFIRSFAFKRDGKAEPSVLEFRDLSACAGGVTMATKLDPDTPSKAVRGHQTRRGQAGTGKRGGRPRRNGLGAKKRLRELKLEKAQALRAEGLSFRKIGEEIGVPWNTVRGWIERQRGN